MTQDLRTAPATIQLCLLLHCLNSLDHITFMSPQLQRMMQDAVVVPRSKRRGLVDMAGHHKILASDMRKNAISGTIFAPGTLTLEAYLQHLTSLAQLWTCWALVLVKVHY